MNLCIVTAAGADGGIEVCDREIADHNIRNNKDVSLIVTEKDFFTDRVDDKVNIIHDLKYNDRKFSFHNLIKSYQFFKKHKPSVVLFDHKCIPSFSSMMIGAKLAGVSCIVSIIYNNLTESKPKEHKTYLGFIPGIGLWWLKQRELLRFSFLVNHMILFATNEHLSRFSKNYGLSSKKWEVVPHLGADTEAFKKDLDIRKKIRDELGLKDEIAVVFVGRLGPEKGVDILLKALPDDVKCFIIGDGPEKDNLMSMAGKNVRFLGRVDSVPPYYNAADIVVVPSREECFGLVLVEAMSSEKPVIGSTAGSIKEIITDGYDGLLFKSEDYKGLNKQIDRLINDKALREKLSKNARKTVLEKYSKKQVLKKMDRILFGK